MNSNGYLKPCEYRRLLESKRADLIASQRRPVIERVAEPNEQQQLLSQADTDASACEKTYGLLHQITAALDKLDHGDYAICEACDEPISPKRMAAVPWASLCLSCQERADLMAKQGQQLGDMA
jgi:DnaK suppressor protein